MQLLHWSTLVPENGLAAIRFTAPLRVSHLRVIPDGVKPFAQAPEIVAETKPECFFADVYFNAQPINPQAIPKEKQRPPNALVPSRIAYFGSNVDYAVNMGSEHATRLLIVQGNFEKLSLALYGEIVSDSTAETSSTATISEPAAATTSAPTPLSPVLDVANSHDPTSLAKQLLAVFPDSPPLQLVIQLVFCLKPDAEDWDHEAFPYLFSDLTKEVNEDELDAVVRETMRPVDEETPSETIQSFVSAVAEVLRGKIEGAAETVAQLLNNVASQKAELVSSLLDQLDLDLILSSQRLDKFILNDLLNATNNADIAQKLNSEVCADLLTEIQNSNSFERETQLAAQRVRTRAEGWVALRHSLLNAEDDFADCGQFLKDICLDDLSLGIWLSSTLNDLESMDKIVEQEEPSDSREFPVELWDSRPSNVTRPEYLRFLRALIGVTAVLAVLAWVDSLGNDDARQHILSILHLWQGVDGYKPIINHLMLMRQFTRRLEWITADNDPPRKSGCIGEQVIFELAQDPRAVLRPHFMNTILSLSPPLTVISEHERLSLRKLALVAEDGLPAAVDELTFMSDRPISLRRLRTIRLSLALVDEHLSDSDGEASLLRTLWEETTHSFIDSLVGILQAISEDLCGQLRDPNLNDFDLLYQLCCAGHELLQLLIRLLHCLPMTAQCLRILTNAIVGVCVADHALRNAYPESDASTAATTARSSCYVLALELCKGTVHVEPDRLAATILLQTLFTHAPLDDKGHAVDDPIYHNVQILELIDHVLPRTPSLSDLVDEDSTSTMSYWVFDVFPAILPELKAFFQIQDTKSKVHLVKKLVDLDRGQTGLAEWIVMEELKALLATFRLLESSSDSIEDDPYIGVALYEVHLALRFIRRLVDPASETSVWFVEALSSVTDLSNLLSLCLLTLIEGHYEDESLRTIAVGLTTHTQVFEGALQFTVAMAHLRLAFSELALDGDVVEQFRKVSKDAISFSRLSFELGRTLLRFSKSPTKPVGQAAEKLLNLLEWFVSTVDVSNLTGIKMDVLSNVLDDLMEVLSPESASRLQSVRVKVSVDEDVAMFSSHEDPIRLPQQLHLPLRSLQQLLRPQGSLSGPSTPHNGHKTPEELGVIISPPTALLRSYTSTGLTKKYSSNEFRELRLSPIARQNTSRLPSTHVDAFNPDSLISPIDLLPGPFSMTQPQ